MYAVRFKNILIIDYRDTAITQNRCYYAPEEKYK